MFGLNKYVIIGLAASAMANVSLGYLYKEALQDTARIQLQEHLDRAIAIQERTEVAALAQAAAAEARETQLLSRLAQSNQVAEEAAERALDAYGALEQFDRGEGLFIVLVANQQNGQKSPVRRRLGCRSRQMPRLLPVETA